MAQERNGGDGMNELLGTLVVILTLLLWVLWNGGETSLPPEVRDLKAPVSSPSSVAPTHVTPAR